LALSQSWSEVSSRKESAPDCEMLVPKEKSSVVLASRSISPKSNACDLPAHPGEQWVQLLDLAQRPHFAQCGRAGRCRWPDESVFRIVVIDEKEGGI